MHFALMVLKKKLRANSFISNISDDFENKFRALRIINDRKIWEYGEGNLILYSSFVIV